MREPHWQEIDNVYAELPGYNCFACSPLHPSGFRLKFYHDPAAQLVVSPLSGVKEEMAGFPGIVHGGFQAMLLDEAMCWAALHFEKRLVFTAGMSIRLSRPMPTQTPCLIKAKIDAPGARMISARAWIEAHGQTVASARGELFVPKAGDVQRNLGLDETPKGLRPYLRA
ncbi:MAG: PaaI family thioesterase [Desulfovibrionaceae bacterium]|nr:PaaI family thioesterase [Desulfovibrionaceae bacterium]